MKDQWLSLSEMADEFGVHPSTIRKWADDGDLPVHRTPGGHRRFLRREVELWQEAQQADSPHDVQMVVNHAMREIRLQISEGNLENESWYQKLDQQARRQYRQSGRSLLQGLRAFLSTQGQEAIAEAQSLGYEYASRGRQHQLNAVEATQAFLFFRNSLMESMLQIYESASVQSAQVWSSMFRRMNQFTDQILISLMSTYHQLEQSKGPS